MLCTFRADWLETRPSNRVYKQSAGLYHDCHV
jgi:hypothetical protein